MKSLPAPIALSLLALLPCALAQSPDPASPRFQAVVEIQDLFASSADSAVTLFVADRFAPALMDDESAVDELTEAPRQTGLKVDRQPLDDRAAFLFAGKDSDLDESANRDATCQTSAIKTGVYKISPSGANRDAVWVTIEVISSR